MPDPTLSESAVTEPTLDQQIARAASAYAKARRYGTAEEITEAYAELQRLLALRDG